MILKEFLVGVSGFAIGLIVYLGIYNLVDAFKSPPSRMYGALAMLRFGAAGALILVLEAVYRAPEIPWMWRTVLYTVCLMFVFFGALGVIIEKGHRRRDR
ncbi:MAG: hypothetical protein ACRDIC_06085 [bacterium]